MFVPEVQINDPVIFTSDRSIRQRSSAFSTGYRHSKKAPLIRGKLNDSE
jgi:hypothetical protein